MFGLLKRKPDLRPVVTVHLNARLQPMHRGRQFEEPLDQWLRTENLGEVSGGGTHFTPGEGIDSCDVELRVVELDDALLTRLADKLAALHAPLGSKLIVEATRREVAIGVSEGLALHLNGCDLPDSVYETCELDELVGLLDGALGSLGAVMSHYDGPRETSLYIYGRSYAALSEAVSPIVASYPLCAQCRLERIV